MENYLANKLHSSYIEFEKQTNADLLLKFKKKTPHDVALTCFDFWTQEQSRTMLLSWKKGGKTETIWWWIIFLALHDLSSSILGCPFPFISKVLSPGAEKQDKCVLCVWETRGEDNHKNAERWMKIFLTCQHNRTLQLTTDQFGALLGNGSGNKELRAVNLRKGNTKSSKEYWRRRQNQKHEGGRKQSSQRYTLPPPVPIIENPWLHHPVLCVTLHYL